MSDGINIMPGICFSCLQHKIINSKGLCIDCHQAGPVQIGYQYRVHYIPARMMPGIKRYVEQGIRPGDFLCAVFENDFKKALMFADDENYNNIQAYAAYLYNVAPHGCHGSAEKVEAWIKQGGLKGLEGDD